MTPVKMVVTLSLLCGKTVFGLRTPKFSTKSNTYHIFYNPLNLIFVLLIELLVKNRQAPLVTKSGRVSMNNHYICFNGY